MALRMWYDGQTLSHDVSSQIFLPAGARSQCMAATTRVAPPSVWKISESLTVGTTFLTTATAVVAVPSWSWSSATRLSS